ncbi:unnamed protein product [Moneuplotes crassus]|uniref:Phosphatidic acid phosphatase type 2/haloperoxidase domain-containing protein n=1 Tax=Euplotes crassus TaxID=5936 RepID=A0AAD1UCN1_EUPCR|nr:unnamed protein product [Moneuplotes crassus]
MELGKQNLQVALVGRQVTPNSQAYSLEKDQKIQKYSSSTSSNSQDGMKSIYSEYGVGSKMKIGTLKIVIIAILFLILDFIFREDIFEYEIQLLSYLRANIQSPGFYTFCKSILWLTELETIKILCIILYFFIDPMIAFKTGILTYIAIYASVNLKFMYAIPRPFWIDHTIDVTTCSLDFSGPSDHTCIGSFFYTYATLYYYFINEDKRFDSEESVSSDPGWISRHKNQINIFLCISIIVIVMLFTGFSLFLLGQTFMFESTIGIIYSILFALFCLKVDNQFYKYSYNTAFNIEKSRRYKFLLLFICIGLFSSNLLIKQLTEDKNLSFSKWAQAPCIVENGTHLRYDLGGDYTFFDNYILFMIVGCVFGCAFASSQIDDFLSRETKTYKKVIRTIIGLIIILGIELGSQAIPVDNYLTEFIFRYGLPNYVMGYFCYGIYPIIWQYLCLLGDAENYSTDESELDQQEESHIQEESHQTSVSSTRQEDTGVLPPIAIRNLDSNSRATSGNDDLETTKKIKNLKLKRINLERRDIDFFKPEEP